MSAWVKQIASQVRKHGKKKASWYCEWNEPNGTRRKKSCGPGKDGRDRAKLLAERIKSQLTLGTYETDTKRGTTWREFCHRYESKVLTGKADSTKSRYHESLACFAKILKLDNRPMTFITSERIAEFVAKRRQEPGKKPDSKLSPASINSNLRAIKAALNHAVEWGYLEKLPKIRMEKEQHKMPRWMTAEHFTAIYESCGVATMPDQTLVEPGEWWRGLLAMGYMTGWRISELLSLKWVDVDLEAGTAITRAEDNKGGRDEVASLHPFVLGHLRDLRTFGEFVFPWSYNRRTLDVQFHRIQESAGIKLKCNIPREHSCTKTCNLYGFHDERRSFATRCRQAGIEAEVLQTLMRHKSYSTTLRYVNMADAVNPSVVRLDAPSVKMA